MQDKKYGLIIRAPKSNNKTQLTRNPIPKPAGFFDDDDDDVERDISRQATKNKSLKDVEELHKKALKEDPSVFDYDGVYDDMKSQMIKPKVQERERREAKYIGLLKEKAIQREREHEIVYERKLAKERSKEDHLFEGKDKFVTAAYKRKLAEKEQWEKEERLRQLREERDDVTKKDDISDFYFNISKNIAFGANNTDAQKQKKQEKEPSPSKEDVKKSDSADNPDNPDIMKQKRPENEPDSADRPSTSSMTNKRSKSEEKHLAGVPAIPERNPDVAQENPPPVEQPSSDQPKPDHHKKNKDAISAAQERYLARKRAKVVEY